MASKYAATLPLNVHDFLHGTRTMTNEEVGAYARLLCHEWESGAVPSADPADLARLLGCTPAKARRLWHRLRAKYERGDDGRYRNRRCQTEREVMRRFAEVQQARARTRWGGC